MSVISLTTEWKEEDFYVGALKGAMLSTNPDAHIIDITHNITRYSIIQAAFIIKSCYESFPKGSVHIICVNSEQTKENNHVAVEHNGHFFICTDNGILGLLFDEKPEKIIKLNNPTEFSTFPELNVFSKAASHLISKKSIDELGVIQTEINLQIGFLPLIDEHDDETTLSGKVIYIDSYENAITNIDKELFYKTMRERKFSIFLQNNNHPITKINNAYSDTEEGELLAIFNSLNLLEIAVRKSSVKQFFKLDSNSQIRIIFS
jgi:hypothetical protein